VSCADSLRADAITRSRRRDDAGRSGRSL